MDPIETLMNEHRLIERGIDALLSFADEVRRKRSDEKEELGQFVTFIREFADGIHHGKEENILFATMVEAGFPGDGGPIAVMLMEHAEGRGYVQALAELQLQDAAWSDEDRQALADAAYGYGDLLRQHIHKEDAILYPMAEQRLPPHLMNRVADECERFEASRAGSGEADRLHALADEIIARHATLTRGEPSPRALAGLGCHSPRRSSSDPASA
jgi:hemerythrin-like domain-containing protein